MNRAKSFPWLTEQKINDIQYLLIFKFHDQLKSLTIQSIPEKMSSTREIRWKKIPVSRRTYDVSVAVLQIVSRD